MKHLLLLPVILIGMHASSFGQTILSGTDIQVRADTPIFVSPLDRGRIYPGRVARDVYTRDGDLAIARGSRAEFIVRQTGSDQLALDVDSVIVNGNRYMVNTTGPLFNMPRDEYDSAGLLAGIMGSISAEPGTEVHLEAHGREIRVPDGAIIRFQFQQPVRVETWDRDRYWDR